MTPAAENGALARDIGRQPSVLRALASRGDAIVAAGRAVQPGPGGRLFVCGCGDGLFASIAASSWAGSLGLDWRPIGALDLVLQAEALRPGDRAIVVSMSGNVDRTVEAAAAVAERGVPIAALVNGAGGRLGAITATKLSLDLEDVAPFLCGTASYTATLATLMLLACGAAGASSRPDLEAAAAAQATMMDADFDTIAQPGGVRMLSAGADGGTAQYGAAKFVELTRVPAWHADLEEFAHSQYWAMPTTDLVVIVAANPALAVYSDETCQALGMLGVVTLAVDTVSARVPRATHRFTLPAMDPALAPLATAVPLQRLAAAMARRSRLDPDTRLHLKQDTTRFAVSRRLTRRSLIGTGQ